MGNTQNTLQHIQWFVNTGETLTTTDGKKVEIWEFQYRKDNEILSAWAKHFRNHYCADEDIDYLRRGYNLSRKNYLQQLKFPDRVEKPGPSIRSGDFGEILTADYLEYILKYLVPRFRYDDKTIRNESKKGCDIIGFKMVNRKKYSSEDRLFIIEVKAQFTGNKMKAKLQEAIQGSIKDDIRKAETLNALKQKYKSEKQLVDIVERFQSKVSRPYIEMNGAAAIVTEEIFNTEIITQTCAEGLNLIPTYYL